MMLDNFEEETLDEDSEVEQIPQSLNVKVINGSFLPALYYL